MRSALRLALAVAVAVSFADAQRPVTKAATRPAAQAPAPPPAHASVVKAEFVFTTQPTPSVHASTIVSTPTGLVVAWFGGRAEGAADVGIWVSRHRRGAWTAPARIASCTVGRRRNPCWNPVLFEAAPGILTLWYRAGPSPREWWGMVSTSRDGGATWSAARRLPDGQLGPIKNKPIRISENVLIAGSSTESTDSVSRWRPRFERSTDNARTWTVIAPPLSDSAVNAIQPTILTHVRSWMQALVRTQSGRIWETWSDNNGVTWSPLAPTALPNPNAGIDAVTLHDRRQLLVYNHAATGRTPLNVAVSQNGIAWSAPIALESAPGEYSYPAVIQTPDSLVHVTYTWKRQRIRHVVLDPRRLASPREPRLDSVVATLLPKLAPLAASRDSLALAVARDSGTARADSAVLQFREAATEMLKTVAASFDDSAFQRAIFPGDSVRRRRLRQGDAFTPPNLAFADSLMRFLSARGVWAFRDEGATYYAISDADVLSTFGRYVRGSVRAWLRLEASEQARPTVEDARLRVSLDDLAERLMVADSVAAQYRGTMVFQPIEWRRASYLYLLLAGTDGSPAFVGGELRPPLRQALDRYAARYGSTPSGRVVRDYITLLRTENFRDTPPVAEFRQRIREAAGPRG